MAKRSFKGNMAGKIFSIRHAATIDMMTSFFDQMEIQSIEEFEKLSWYDQQCAREFKPFTSTIIKMGRFMENPFEQDIKKYSRKLSRDTPAHLKQ